MQHTIMVIMLLILNAGLCAAAECHAPRYRKGHVWEDSRSTIVMNISISMSDFAPDHLVCLADQLRRRYRDRKEGLISIFDTNVAARRYISPTLPDSVTPFVNWAAQMHGVYHFDTDKHEEVVEILPLGPNGSFGTKIDLHAATIPPCTLQLAGRCLLAFDNIDYPWNALKAGVSGTVTLRGVITHDGRLKHVEAVDEVHPNSVKSPLVNAALQNLKTWRLAPARDQSPLTITYSYVIEDFGHPRPTSVKFELPHKVEIRGRGAEGRP